jgi:hypothetical protein
MHARVTTISGSPADADAGIENFRANVVPFAREQGKGAILLVDRQSGEAVAITLWEDEQALRATEESANVLRADAAGQMGAAQAPTVGRYEVAVFEV